MTAGTPMTGRDSAAAFKGLIIGAICVAVVVVTITTLTNRKYASHEATPAASETR
jgi:hypothetical protein